MIKITFINK